MEFQPPPKKSFVSLVAAGVLPFFDAPNPGGGPAVVFPIGAAHKSDESEVDQLLVFDASTPPNFGIVLLKFCCVVVDGLKLHVEDERISFGDVLAVLDPNRSDSLAALMDRLRATLPGVMDGSSSTFFCVP